MRPKLAYHSWPDHPEHNGRRGPPRSVVQSILLLGCAGFAACWYGLLGSYHVTFAQRQVVLQDSFNTLAWLKEHRRAIRMFKKTTTAGEPRRILSDTMYQEALQGLSSSDWMEQSAKYDIFGNMQNLTCVCGCTENEITGTSQVYCAMSANCKLPVWCVVHQGYLYTSHEPLTISPDTTATFGKQSPRIPLLVAVCTTPKEYKNFFAPTVWKQSHFAFGVAFDHVSENRLIQIPPKRRHENNNNTGFQIPSSFVWKGQATGRAQPWESVYNSTTEDEQHYNHDMIAPAAPQLNGATVALIESADCWTHGSANSTRQGINPWHCMAGMLNWGILSRLWNEHPNHLLQLDAYDGQETRFFAWQGMDEFYHLGQPTLTVGGHDLLGQADLRLLAGKGVETSMHDDDHKVREALFADRQGREGYRVDLQGHIPRAILNMAPARSLLWSNANFIGKDHNEPSQVVLEYRNRLLEDHMKVFQQHFPGQHPLHVLRTNFSAHCRWVVPQTHDSNTHLQDQMEAEFRKYKESEWQMNLLSPSFILMWRRSPMNATASSLKSCNRCIENIDDLAQRVSDTTGMPAVLLHPIPTVPVSLQTYLVHACRLVVAMHGGAWGLAYSLGPRQGAVEILPQGQKLTFAHMVDLGKPVYRQVSCPKCRPTGVVDVPFVLEQVQEVLAELQTRETVSTSTTAISTV